MPFTSQFFIPCSAFVIQSRVHASFDPRYPTLATRHSTLPLFFCKIPTSVVTTCMDMTDASALTKDSPLASIDWQAELARHDRWLRSVVLARVGEYQAVDDVMQEVALAAVRQQAPLSDPAKVAPWLYRVAVTQSLQYRRKMGRRRKLADRYSQRARATAADQADADPLRWLLADERRGLIRKALARLAAKDAEILLLKYTENHSYRQLADLLSISVSAVEARLHRARARLRQQLAELDVIERK